jgi:cell division protein FtsB
MKLLVATLVMMLLLLQYRLWIGEGSLPEVWQLEKKLAEQQAENKTLKARNDALEAEVQDLKQGLNAIEERARNDLGMIKENETFYQVIPKPEDKHPSDNRIHRD